MNRPTDVSLRQTSDEDRIRQLGRFVRWLVPVAYLFAVLEAIVFVFYPQPQTALTSLLLGTFGTWLTVTWRRLRPADFLPFVTRLAMGLLGIVVANVILQPTVVAEVTVATLLPVLVVLPYLDDRGLRRLIAFTWFTGVLVTVIGEVLPDTGALPPVLSAGMRIGAMGFVYGMGLLLLWQFSSKLKATAGELRSLVALSSDLAQTMNPLQIGDLMAEHLATAAGADECGICYWDRANNRVLTYGYFPRERRSAVDEAYDLAEYPATRRVLEDQTELTVSTDDAAADPAEVKYLGSLGMRSMAMLPMVARGESIGAVEVYFTSPSAAIGSLDLTRVLIDEAAIALDNARLYEELRHQAFHDGLTGLANRALFGDRVSHALARSARVGSRLAVLFLDLDDFKTVNDRFGHPAGDQLLRVVAERLTTVLRPGDTAARLGGDEFAVLLEDLAEPNDARVVAERLIDVVRAPVPLGEIDALVGASVGVALATAGDERAEDLLRNADFAMYRAKSAGKGRHEVFQAQMRAGIEERGQLEELIQYAVERSELRLAYQPIVELSTGMIVGVEALLRWQPANRPLLMPTDFISLAEETGQIVPIGQWAVAEACRQAHRWQEQLGQRQFGVSVNLSARQFQHTGLVGDVLAAVGAAGIDPESLTLEITESVLMQHTASTIDKLTTLRAAGVRLSIDDFGTGYSSLSYLDKFPVDALKIDRTFVEAFGEGHDGPVLVKAIIELGQALGLEIVAEGIERADQLDPLRRLGCRFGQGFLFSRPIDPDALAELLAGPALHRDEGLVSLPRRHARRARRACGTRSRAGAASPATQSSRTAG